MSELQHVVRVTGPDRPGILAGVMAVLSHGGAQVIDIEQITIRGRLDLNIVVTSPPGSDMLKELLLFGYERQMDVAFELVSDVVPTCTDVVIVTALARELGPVQLGALAAAIAEWGGNIERITRLADRPVASYELTVIGCDVATLRSSLLSVARSMGIDVAVQLEGLHRRAMRLVVLDVDSTLIQDEVIDLLADEAGCIAEVAAITERAMNGELDFEASLRARVALLAGLDAEAIGRVRDRIRYTPGARTFISTLQRLGYRTAIVSGGFTQITDHLQAELGIDHAHANVLEVVDGRLTGRVLGEVVDRAGKARILRSIAEAEGVPLDQVVAIGDGANDLDMLASAGLGVAFNAKPSVREAAAAAVNVPYLDAVLFLLGVRRDHVVD